MIVSLPFFILSLFPLTFFWPPGLPPTDSSNWYLAPSHLGRAAPDSSPFPLIFLPPLWLAHSPNLFSPHPLHPPNTCIAGFYWAPSWYRRPGISEGTGYLHNNSSIGSLLRACLAYPSLFLPFFLQPGLITIVSTPFDWLLLTLLILMIWWWSYYVFIFS